MRSTIAKMFGAAGLGLLALAGAALATGPDLAMPTMDPVRGKQLFASKGCVVCHSINGIGGTDALKLDASTMTPKMNPFEFFAKMWKGAEPMIAMQNSELGHQIEFTGQDLADIVAFAHDAAVQKTFSEKDIPAAIKAYMEEEGHKDKASPGDMGPRQGMGSGMMGSGTGSGMMGGSKMGR